MNYSLIPIQLIEIALNPLFHLVIIGKILITTGITSFVFSKKITTSLKLSLFQALLFILLGSLAYTIYMLFTTTLFTKGFVPVGGLSEKLVKITILLAYFIAEVYAQKIANQKFDNQLPLKTLILLSLPIMIPIYIYFKPFFT